MIPNIHKIRRDQHRQRSGWTLLELILSLALSVIVIGLINSALQIYYYSLAKVQSSTDQDQLARALLRRIGDDVRATVRYEKFDGSGFMTLPTGTSGASAAISAATSGSSSSTTSSSTSGSTTGPSTRGGGTSSSTGGTSFGTGTTSGTNSTTDSTMDQSQSEEESTTDPATVRQIPGIYGTKTTLQVDVCRIPRADEDTTVDVRSTSYFVNTTNADKNSNGLIRLERSRASALFSSQNGSEDTSPGIVLAPEVVYIEFLYFDPIAGAWVEEWDSTVSNNVPKAVKIIMVIDKPKLSQTQNNESLIGMSIDQVRDKYPEALFQTVINLPAWAVAKPDTETTSSSSTSSSSSSSGTSSGTGASSGASTGGTSTGGSK